MYYHKRLLETKISNLEYVLERNEPTVQTTDENIEELRQLREALKNMESSSHSQPHHGFYYWVKFNEDTEYEVAYCYRYKNNTKEFQPTNGESAYTNEVIDWKQEPIIFNG